jgi:hypothetical protein
MVGEIVQEGNRTGGKALGAPPCSDRCPAILIFSPETLGRGAVLIFARIAVEFCAAAKYTILQKGGVSRVIAGI